MTRPWTSISEAAALLADCAANPPETRTMKVVGLSTYHAKQYVGAKVRQLRAIWKAEGARLLAEADRTGDYDAYDSHTRYDVQTAIADAIFFALLAKSAEIDAQSQKRRAA